MLGFAGDTIVCNKFVLIGLHSSYSSGLGSVVVFTATIFALWSKVTNGSTAIVIVQAGIFAEASRQLVKYALSTFDDTRLT